MMLGAKGFYSVTDITFADLGLSGRLLRALTDAQYETPTPIQARAIPFLLDGRDLLGIAQTGTGKTAAFTLPLLHKLEKLGTRTPQRGAHALILAPTRELVIQIADSIKTYSKHGHLRRAVIMGGVGARPQINALRKGVDILVATPGRLLDLMNQGHVDLSHTEHLVLDEGDRMLDMGFIKDVRRIVATMPTKRQTLLFSATMPAEVAKLARDILDNPERVEIAAKSVAVDRIEQRVHHVSVAQKGDRLVELLGAQGVDRVIVFTRTKRGADKVVKNLGRTNLRAEAIHGNKSQGQRQRALDMFRKGKVRVLVATDIASRGIDIDDVSHVINYDLPHEPESYVHRIGRTARAGADGIAISLCGPDERSQLRAIERLIKRPLDVVGTAPADLPAAPRKKSGGRKKFGGSKKPGGRTYSARKPAPDNGRQASAQSPKREAAPSADARASHTGEKNDSQQQARGVGKRRWKNKSRGASGAKNSGKSGQSVQTDRRAA